jgi:hypothetical protein
MYIVQYTVPGSLNKKGGRRCNLLLNKRWNLLPSFLSNEPGTCSLTTVEEGTIRNLNLSLFFRLPFIGHIHLFIKYQNQLHKAEQRLLLFRGGILNQSAQ